MGVMTRTYLWLARGLQLLRGLCARLWGDGLEGLMQPWSWVVRHWCRRRLVLQVFRGLMRRPSLSVYRRSNEEMYCRVLSKLRFDGYLIR